MYKIYIKKFMYYLDNKRLPKEKNSNKILYNINEWSMQCKVNRQWNNTLDWTEWKQKRVDSQWFETQYQTGAWKVSRDHHPPTDLGADHKRGTSFKNISCEHNQASD